MALELKQVPKLAQQTIMTPQLQQSIKLLQLSRLELTNLIQKEIIENPVLEEAQDFHEGEDTPQIDNTKDDQYDNPSEEEPYEKEEIDLGVNWDSYIKGNFSEGYGRSVEKDDGLSLESRLTKETSLCDHLMWQLRLSSFTKDEELIGAFIIGNIDEDGYLRTTLEDIAEASGMDESVVSGMLKRIQEFDPLGIGARDLKECLLIQAKHLIEYNPVVEEILNNHLHELENRNFQLIAKKLEVSLDEVIHAASLITELDPKPGRYLSKEEPRYITPDIYVYKVGNDFFIVLNEDGMPKLKINPFYRDALSQKDHTSKVTKEYIQGKIRSAVWLIKSVHQRQRTIYKVMESIIKFQNDFFEKGSGALKPLSLKIIAGDIGMHESTVSRVTTHKYVHTPQGIFELKYFFNSAINCKIGESIASESVKDKIRHIILNENTKKPHSDKKIMEILEGHNINIARRTVTKYREMLNILPSSKRKKVF